MNFGINDKGLERIIRKVAKIAHPVDQYIKRNFFKNEAVIYFDTHEDANSARSIFEENGIQAIASYNKTWGLPTLVFSYDTDDDTVLNILEENGLANIVVPPPTDRISQEQKQPFLPNMEEIEDWWEYLDPATQKYIVSILNLPTNKLNQLDAQGWEELINYYAQTVEGDERGWQRGQNV